MTFTLGTGQLSYDHFGVWSRQFDVTVSIPDGYGGDPDAVGETQPGFSPGDDALPLDLAAEAE